MNLEWMNDAVCRQVDYEMFFPEGGGGSVAARKVCGGCEVKTECLSYALEFPSMIGIWGGTTAKQRQKLKQRSTTTIHSRGE